MELTVVWHKPCWASAASPTGFAAHGGLPRQITALSELFDATRVVGPRREAARHAGETAIAGRNLTVVPLTWLPRSRFLSWVLLPVWLVRNGPRLVGEIRRADAVFPLIPSPIGILALILALGLRKRILTRQLNGWSDPRLLWRLQRALLERIAGGRNVVFATGRSDEPPSRRNPSIRWLFTTTVSERERASNAVPRALEPGREARLILVGREVEIRGVLVVLRALPLVARDFPNVTLDVVGDGATPAAASRLAREVQRIERVTFHGPVDHAGVLELLRRADLLCVLDAETEGFRQAVQEGLACGLPLVAARSSILPGIAECGCGILLEEKTPEAVAEAVVSALGDPERYRRMSAAAVRAAEPHTLERWRDTLRSALESAWGPLRSVAASSPAADDRQGAALAS